MGFSALPQTRLRRQPLALSVLWGSSSFSLPTAELALAEMQGTCATIGRLGLDRRAYPLGSAASPTQYEVLQKFFKNPKDCAASPGTSAVSPGAAAGKPPAIGPRADATGASASGDRRWMMSSSRMRVR